MSAALAMNLFYGKGINVDFDISSRDARMNSRKSRVLHEVKKRIGTYLDKTKAHNVDVKTMILSIYNVMLNTNMHWHVFQDATGYERFYYTTYLKAKELSLTVRSQIFLDDEAMIKHHPFYEPAIVQAKRLYNQSLIIIEKYKKYYAERVAILEAQGGKYKLPTDVIVFDILEFAGIRRPDEFRIKYTSL